jgi:hypothetical protein
VGLTGRLAIGQHQVCVRATDRVGNVSAGNSCAMLTIQDLTPPGVASFVPQATTTGAVSMTYSLVMSEPISGLTGGDFVIGGSSTGWTIGSVSGSGALYSLTVGSVNPSIGTLELQLLAGSVVDAAGNPGPVTPANAASISILPFIDIVGSTFQSDIVWISQAGITSGCGPRLYCPLTAVTRAQMASFLARALHLTGPAPDAFVDDEASVHEPDINLMAREGITTGCGGGMFCPDGFVSRQEMASFLARALHLSGPAADAFGDDEFSPHETNINLVAREGIATGCGPSLYCPIQNVTRGQMAAFLHRAFD